MCEMLLRCVENGRFYSCVDCTIAVLNALTDRHIILANHGIDKLSSNDISHLVLVP